MNGRSEVKEMVSHTGGRQPLWILLCWLRAQWGIYVHKMQHAHVWGQ